MISCQMTIATERFPLVEPFVISRGVRTEATVVTVTLKTPDGKSIGRGECTPYPRYGESVESVIAQIDAIRDSVEIGLNRHDLQAQMAAGAARNALDSALWDLEAKKTGIPASVTAGLKNWQPAISAFTISIGSPEQMEKSARKAADRPVLKIKLGGADGKDIERIRAVRQGAPKAILIADANEAWRADNLPEHLAACTECGFSMVEQPLPAKEDADLATLSRTIPICADESVHDRQTLTRLMGLYDLINIKLDKTGGLTEALTLAQEAERLGFGLMIGCMLGTSLAMAPAMILANKAQFIDLDGPLLLSQDRTPPLRFQGSKIYPPSPELWG